MPFTSQDLLLAANAVPLSFNLALALAAFGAAMLCPAAEITAAARSTVLYKKFAQQISRMGLLFGLYIVMVAGGAALMMHFKVPGALQGGRDLMPATLLLGLPLAWVVLHLAYAATWKQAKSLRAAHITLGVVSGLFGLAALLGPVLVGKLWLSPLHAGPDGSPDLGAALFESGTPVLIAFLVQLAPLALAVAASLGPAALHYRRKRDDWGRDYYNFALSHTARWAAAALAVFLLAHAWFVVLLVQAIGPLATLPSIRLPWAAGMAAALALTACWLWLAKSATPLRMKILTAAAIALLWIMLGCLVFSGLKVLILS